MTTIHELAAEMARAFETRTHDDGTRFDALRDGSPEWMTDVVRAAHGDMLPDDYRYAMIREAVDWLAGDGGDPDDGGEFADQAVNVYTTARTHWLASHLDRVGYVDQAREEFGPAENTADQIGQGWYVEANEVYRLTADALAGIAGQVAP